MAVTGDATCGGDTFPVHSDLRSVQHAGCMQTHQLGHSEPRRTAACVRSDARQVCGTYSAFAALKQNGTVLAWGDADWGGDTSQVEEELKGVSQAPTLWLVDTSSGQMDVTSNRLRTL